MNLLGCLIPCGLEQSLSKLSCGEHKNEFFTNRMGANSSSASGLETGCLDNSNNANYPALRESQSSVIVRDRKKRVTGFATIKKRFIKRRRSSKACDHGRSIRDFVADWSRSEITVLLEEYEMLAALKDISVQAELARPPAATFKQDLSALYDFKYCTDADLVYRGACFPIHRAFLSVRCPYFRHLLAECPGYGARITLEVRTAAVDVQLFSVLLRYLYTGDICPYDTPSIDINVLRRLRDEFGTPNTLEMDLRYLLEVADYADAALVFTTTATANTTNNQTTQNTTTNATMDGCSPDLQRPDSGSSEYGFRPKLEIPCHKAILSARCPFFRNLLQKRSRSGEDYNERVLHIPTRIVLDEHVMPKRYAHVLLHAIYLDHVDLSLITHNDYGGGLGEAQALTYTGRTHPTLLEEAMELYQIGRFLDLDILSQGCEDIILEWLSLDTLPTVLQWAKQPHGSPWIHRQALHFLREEFQMIVQSPVLHQLDKSHLMEVLDSQFLQASELEILTAVLKWGEHQLMRRMEDREPNLVSQTAHSLARKGVKKRDLNDVELREILADLLPLIRINHVLPPNSELLNQTIQRGLVSVPPSHMIGGDRENNASTCSNNNRVNSWIPTNRCGSNANSLYVQPRLFMPYYDEIKTLMEDRLLLQHHQNDVFYVRRSNRADIPDTLYMVDTKPRLHSMCGGSVTSGSVATTVTTAAVTVTLSSSTTAAVPAPVTTTTTSGQSSAAVVLFPCNEPVLVNAMLKREVKLRQSPSCQRALNMHMTGNSDEVGRQIRLRVVREFNLPDYVADQLEHYRHLNAKDTILTKDSSNNSIVVATTAIVHDECLSAANNLNNTKSVLDEKTAYKQQLQLPTSSNFITHNDFQEELGATGVSTATINSSSMEYRLSANEMHSTNSLRYVHHHHHRHHHHHQHQQQTPQQHPIHHHLSDLMPDVAMATAGVGHLQLHEIQQEMELDLGDRRHNGSAGSGGHLTPLQHPQQHLPLPPSYHHAVPYRHYLSTNSLSSHARQNTASGTPPSPQQQSSSVSSSYLRAPSTSRFF